MKKCLRNLCAFVLLTGVGPHLPASEATYKALAYLNVNNQPIGIVEGAKGVFYSSSQFGVIATTTSGVLTLLSQFPDPPYILESAPGAIGANGQLYSSVEQVKDGGSGTIFSVVAGKPGPQVYPNSDLAPTIAGSLPNGEIFGVAATFPSATWAFSRVKLDGTPNAFFQFPSTYRPYTPIRGFDGNFYGTVQVAGGGALFYRLTPEGVFAQIVTIPIIISYIGAGTVLQGSDGNFYGIQSTGSGCDQSNQHGGVYKITPDGKYTLLHDFGVCGGAIVSGLIEASDGNLYGAIEGNNSIFRMTKSGQLSYVFTTTNPTTQGLCFCTLTQGSDGLIYGTAVGGGPSGAGVVFSLDVGLPIPKPQAAVFSPASGAVGTQVLIWGNNMLQSTVQFNGVAATEVKYGGPQYVSVTVPAGATTGPITVTTKGGVSTTQQSFQVE